MTTIRPITFDQLEAGMILGIEDGEQPTTYIVNSVTKVEQYSEILSVELINASSSEVGVYDKRMWGEHAFEQRGIKLIGQRINGTPTWLSESAEVAHDPNFEPDPAIHEQYINAVVIDGVKFQIGESIENIKICKIVLTDGVLYYYNKNDALICETNLGNAVYSVMMGYREKEAEA